MRSKVKLDIHFVACDKILNAFAHAFDDASHIDTQDNRELLNEYPCLLDLVVDGIEGGSVDFDEELALAGPWDVTLTNDKSPLLRFQEQSFLFLRRHGVLMLMVNV